MDTTGALMFKKGEQPKIGNAYAAWEGRPQITYRGIPGGEMLSFDLSQLTLNDFEAMRYHPQINSSLSVLTFMIHQGDWRIECEDARIRSMVEENMAIIWTRLVRAMSQAYWAGFSPCVLEYENDPQGRFVVINKVKDLSPHEAEVKWKKHDRKINGRTHNYVTYDGIHQYGYGDIPAINTLWYPVLMENGNYEGRKLLKSAFAPWFYSQLMHIYTNRYFERFGEPLPIGRAPFEDEIVQPDGTRITAKQVMEEVMEGIRSRSSVILPSDRDASTGTGANSFLYDIDYLESQMRGVDFERYLTRLDEEMSLALFTPLLLLRNADVGSHNLGVQHAQTWLWMLNALLADMKEYIDRYICERLKAINFTPNAPRCEWVPRKMGKESVETLRAIVVELIRGGKAKVDTDELGVQLGLTVSEVRELTEPEPEETAVEVDDRQRTERPRARSGPRNVGSDRTPGTRTITNRVRTQVATSWSSGVIHIESLNDFERQTLGERADSVDAIIAALHGLSTEDFDSVDSMMNVFRGGLARAGAA
jgi:hypothetical protein